MFLNDPDIVRIAEEHKSTPGQVALSWGVKQGIVVIPKSENPERIKQNITVRHRPFFLCFCSLSLRFSLFFLALALSRRLWSSCWILISSSIVST